MDRDLNNYDYSERIRAFQKMAGVVQCRPVCCHCHFLVWDIYSLCGDIFTSIKGERLVEGKDRRCGGR